MALSDADRRILAFEGASWLEDEPKAGAIRRQLGISPATYYRRLAVLIDSPDALDLAPLVVRRLRRRRTEQRRERLLGTAVPDRPRR